MGIEAPVSFHVGCLAPLIIHHQGFSPYLPFCLWQNIRTQPERPIVLLGDGKNRIRGMKYYHVDSADYQGLNRNLIAAYRHATEADFYDERRCLERWFILAEFLQKNKSTGFYFADSDYLLFANLAEVENLHDRFQAFGTPNIFGFAYLPDKKPVLDFCLWLLDLYKNEKRFLKLYQEHQKAGGRLQEMAYLQAFCRESGLNLIDQTWKNPGKNPCFDDGSFGSSFRYTKDFFGKLVQKVRGGALKFREPCGQRSLAGLHFGGHQKNQIPGFTGWSEELIVAFFRPNLRRNLKYLFQYLFFGELCRRKIRIQSF